MNHQDVISDRALYPRPDFIRQDWMSLDGTWEFAFPGELQYSFPEGYEKESLPGRIQVPFCYQSAASGIGLPENLSHKVYYAKSFSLDETQLSGEVLLKFGAVDYRCDLWLNGHYAGSHQGGHTQFEFPVAKYLRPGKNRIYLLAEDDNNCDKPRGKQYWKEQPDRCWYTNTTGIWKSVWLEFTREVYIQYAKITPDIDRRLIELELFLNKTCCGALDARICFKGHERKDVTCSFENTAYIREVISLAEEDSIDEVHYWTVETPNLYALTLSLNTGQTDCVECYFGMRKIETRDGRIFLNNRPLYQRLILDQGYWEGTLMTPPSGDALREDIEWTKALGFNGARKHQKLEDARYYYYADLLGLFVWCEMPSGYLFNDREISQSLSEWQEILRESYNHPCIITWVPLNESWGVRNILTDQGQQAFAAAMYYTTRAYDPLRPVSTNDGWEVPAHTDLFCLHDYSDSGKALSARYQSPQSILETGASGRQPLVHNATYNGQPFLLSEYGGIALGENKKTGSWGYHKPASSEDDYIRRIADLTSSIRALPWCQGYCYTQLTDVMQEVNGLLTATRQPKAAVESLHKIFSK